MALPNPLPDNPLRWDGWRNYNSENLYARLGLEFDQAPSAEQIEENCRLLLVWWQKKLPLKNQPSNPMTQLLRGGMDEAPQFLVEARSKLLDPAIRSVLDDELRQKVVADAITEFKKVIEFAIFNGELTADAEDRLYDAGTKLGLLKEEMVRVLDSELARINAVRVSAPPPPPPVAVTLQPAAAPTPVGTAPGVAASPFDEFLRVLRLSKLGFDGEELTDDQRDALCNMGESLGLTGGQAEDLIDEYLDEAASKPMQASAPPTGAAVAVRPARPVTPPVANGAAAKKQSAPVAPKKEPVAPATEPIINISPMARIQERAKYPNFGSPTGIEMMLVPSGKFQMGSAAREAAAHEQPVLETTIGCFFMSRFPITNAQYEKFDPSHKAKRSPWGGDSHPVVYVSSKEAVAFCQWLSSKENRRYRLPTEAEWEYAARGSDNRVFPWGGKLDAGHFANFADRRTNFPWRDINIDDGYAETAPVGSYPRGASPFGIEDLSGNVFEWCLDFFDLYRGIKARVNPRGPVSGQKRVYRGGSWKSRSSSLRTSARAFNVLDYSSNDVGFRVICECE